MRSSIKGHYYVFWWSPNEDPNTVQPSECDSYKEAVDCASEYRRKGYESSILSPEGECVRTQKEVEPKGE